eukprot:2362616-Rhodomonas_salina.1
MESSKWSLILETSWESRGAERWTCRKSASRARPSQQNQDVNMQRDTTAQRDGKGCRDHPPWEARELRHAHDSSAVPRSAVRGKEEGRLGWGCFVEPLAKLYGTTRSLYQDFIWSYVALRPTYRRAPANSETPWCIDADLRWKRNGRTETMMCFRVSAQGYLPGRGQKRMSPCRLGSLLLIGLFLQKPASVGSLGYVEHNLNVRGPSSDYFSSSSDRGTNAWLDNAANMTQEERWDGKFVQLMFYKQTFGHCNVPLRLKRNSSLATWVNWQRESRKQGRLLHDRALRLSEMGFQWDWEQVKTSLWLLRYFELMKFRQDFGHCNVPRRWHE